MILLSGSFDFILTLFCWDEDRLNLVILLNLPLKEIRMIFNKMLVRIV